MGLDEKAFWDSNPSDIEIYTKAERIKLNNENFMMYIQGAYIYQGVSAAIANAFSSKGRQYKYINKPFNIFPDEEEKNTTKEIEMIKLKAFLNMLERGSKK